MTYSSSSRPSLLAMTCCRHGPRPSAPAPPPAPNPATPTRPPASARAPSTGCPPPGTWWRASGSRRRRWCARECRALSGFTSGLRRGGGQHLPLPLPLLMPQLRRPLHPAPAAPAAPAAALHLCGLACLAGLPAQPPPPAPPPPPPSPTSAALQRCTTKYAQGSRARATGPRSTASRCASG